MKLLLIFLVFFFFALVQEIGARPYPEDSSSPSSWWYSWLTPRSNGYGSDISKESADLLKQQFALAYQILDLAAYVPGLEPVSQYGKMGMKMAENLGIIAVEPGKPFKKQNNNLINTLETFLQWVRRL